MSENFYEIKENPHDASGQEYKRSIVFLKDKKVDFVLHLWFESDEQHELLGFQISTTEEEGCLINWNKSGEFTLNEYHQGHGLRRWQHLRTWRTLDLSAIDYFLKRIETEYIDGDIKEAVLPVLLKKVEKKQS